MSSSPKRPWHQLHSSRHSVLIGLAVIVVAVALLVGLFVQIAGYRLISIDRRDPAYPSVTTRQIARDTPQPPFVVQYPITKQPQVDTTIQLYAHHLINTYMQERSTRKDATEDEQLQVGYTIRWYDNRTLTTDFTTQKHRTNRIWDKHTETLTFDLTSGRQLSSKDIVKNAHGLANILYDYRRVNNHSGWSAADLIALLDLDTTNIKDAVPYDDEIVFTIAVGQRLETVAIRKSLLEDIVAPEYLAQTNDKNLQQPNFPETIGTMPSRDQPVDPNGKKLALTFDDGPGSLTPRLLDALYKYRAHATFFVIGKNVAPHAATIRREIQDGHEVGNHTWNHPDLRLPSGAVISQQITDTQAAIGQASGGYVPHLMRPPYGSINSDVAAHLQGLTPILWNVDTNDWRDKDAAIVYDRIMAGAGQGNTILLHDIHPTSVEAAIRAIRQLRADGWQLVTISQL